MPTQSLAKKLKLIPSAQAALLNAPSGYSETLSLESVSFDASLNGAYDWIQIFVKSKAELDAIMPQVKTALKPAGLLWISFPKGTSKIQTDLTRDKGWDSVQDMKWTSLVSVNETWSAFSLRLYKTGEARQSFR